MPNPYTPDFFAERAQRADKDARLMVPDIACALGKCPSSVIDFGCGDGSFLRWFKEMGAKSLVGVDQHGPDDWAKKGGLHVRLDLTQPINLGVKADLVVCLEVAEHLPEISADTLVANLVAHGARILFSAAPIGQGGTDHLNEQPMEYWIEKFKAHNYYIQDIIRHRLHGEVSPWYRANTVLFCRQDAMIRVPRTKACVARYRDCFRDVEDAISDLTKSALIPRLYNCPGLAIHELGHDAMICKVRSEIASETITSPMWSEFEYSIWIDADQVFRPQQAIDLIIAAHEGNYDILSGIYVTKQKKARIIHRVNGQQRMMPLGAYAKPYQVDGVGFGFVVTRNSIFTRMSSDFRSGVKRVWLENGKFVFDFFRTQLGETRGEWLDPLTGVLSAPWWSEDTGFCEKAKACGIEIWVQPQICVGHRGRFDFGIENLDLVHDFAERRAP